MHGAKLVGLPGIGGKLEARGRRRLSAQPAQGGEADAAEGALDLAGDRVRHGLCARRDRSPRRRCAASTASPSTWTARASPTRSCRSAARPAEMTWKRGVDILSFGATKNGCLMAEAIVVFDKALRRHGLPRQARRPDHFEGPPHRRAVRGLFRETITGSHNARHANAHGAGASRRALRALPGVRLAWPTEANEVFPDHSQDASTRRCGRPGVPIIPGRS